MTKFIKLPCGDWINPAQIQIAHKVPSTTQINVVFPDGFVEYDGPDAIALAAALDAMSIKEGA